MTDLEKLTRRVEQLESRVEIEELTSAYAVACDEHDMDRLGSLFAEDAVMDSPSKLLHANGRDEILAMFVRYSRNMAADTSPVKAPCSCDETSCAPVNKWLLAANVCN